MKILHTSDWHLGHSLYNYDRVDEQKSMLSQIVKIVEERQPDLFLLSGDVYHTSQPSTTAQTMFTETMMALHIAAPSMTIVVTAGNHDSGAKHEIFRAPWRALNVFTIGSVTRDYSSIDDYIIEIQNKGFVIAVPYVHERNIPTNFYQTLIDNVTERNMANLPIIMSAHTTVKGSDFTGHDSNNEQNIGGIDSHEISELGCGYDYLALGHIHHEQFVRGSEHRARYSGTPLAISFDENFTHSVTYVEINSHNEAPKIEKIEIQNIKPLVTLPTNGAADWATTKELFIKFPDNIPAYIRLNVEIEDFLPFDANDEAQNIAASKQCRFCFINPIRKNKQHQDTKTFTVSEFQAENPIDVARRYVSDSGGEFDDELTSLFNEVLETIKVDDTNH